jgi:hypothetical protein
VSLGAVEGGHVHILKWLKETGKEIDEEACLRGAMDGHKHVVTWCRYFFCGDCHVVFFFLEAAMAGYKCVVTCADIIVLSLPRIFFFLEASMGPKHVL